MKKLTLSMLTHLKFEFVMKEVNNCFLINMFYLYIRLATMHWNQL